MSKLQFSGEFNLQEIFLESANGKIADLKRDTNLIEVVLFEDIFKVGLTGSVIIADTNNLITNLPIVGQENLYFKISTPSFKNKEDIIDFSRIPFVVNKIVSRAEVSTSAQVYELQFISPEVLTSYRKKISKSYTDSIDNIVKDILTNSFYLNTTKDIEIEPTVGNRRIVIPNSRPFSAIERLTRESISKIHGSPHYLFYENKNGFNFKTLQELYSDNSKQDFNTADNLSGGAINDPSEVPATYKRIINYEITANKNMLLSVSGGMLGSRLITHDIYKKEYEEFTYNYFNEFDKYDRIDNGDPVYSETEVENTGKSLGGFPNSRLYVHPTSTTTDYLDAQHYTKENKSQFTSNKSHNWLQHRRQRFFEYMNGINMAMTVHGQTNLTIGDMVSVSLPNIGDYQNEDPYLSGKYLITQLRHTFSIGTSAHEISMIIKRDSISDRLPGTFNRGMGKGGFSDAF